MSWLNKILPPKITTEERNKTIPEGLWTKCPSCNTALYKDDLIAHQHTCKECGHHFRINARKRIDTLLDDSPRIEIAQEVVSLDPLRFKDSKKYPDRLKEAKKSSQEDDALVVIAGQICGIPATVAAFDFFFMGGSMGSAVGERFVRGVEYSIENKMPFICVSATGGARMQESLLSLMQMAKTNASLTLLAKEGLPFISVLTDPTMGGVSASFAFMGDVVIAEPKALVGFAGPRVIEQTVRETLPEGFQRAEFLLQKGAIDMIVERKDMKVKIAKLLATLQKQPSEAVLI
jgi:acetyl-CoA carboxylase carboxyl transferase subunit beta